MRRNVEGDPFCVVIFAKEDLDVARELVDSLRTSGLATWWSEEINHGEWDLQVQEQIRRCGALIPLVTANTATKSVFKGEWRYASLQIKPVFPFVLDEAGMPLEAGLANVTNAAGWDQTARSPAFQQLRQKLARHFGTLPLGNARRHSLRVGGKELSLPAFIFSLSSFETQLDPYSGLDLLLGLKPRSCLVSAFDVNESRIRLAPLVKQMTSSPTVTFLDSGNYEASRIERYADSTGWSAAKFWDIANAFEWDLVFSFDKPNPRGSAEAVADQVLEAYFDDMLHTGLPSSVLCPIVHLPSASKDRATDAARIVAAVASEISPLLVAIPERELGDGVQQRMHAVRSIRRGLDTLGHHQPLHILGTGNPVTMAALALCGADTFDGLEWCRTAANYETNNLMHFHQFDALAESFVSRMSNAGARAIVELSDAPFAIRAATYNFDYFDAWAGFLQHSVHSAEPQRVFHSIPYLGNVLAREYTKGERKP